MGPQEVKLQKLRQIYQALLHLLQKKELIDISISELCKVARVSRTYYYRNFHSLQDIILRYKSWEMSAYLRRTQHAKEVNFITLMTVYFKLQKEEAESVILLANAGLTETLITTFETVYSYLIEQGYVKLQKKELIDISISELCKVARVSRTYYYRNFHSLQDIILRYKSWEMSAYLRRTQHAKEVNFITLMTVYFKLQKEEAESVILLANAGLTETLITTFETVYSYLIEQGYVKLQRKNNKYTSIFMAGAVISVELRWIQSGMKETPQEMGEILSVLFNFDK